MPAALAVLAMATRASSHIGALGRAGRSLGGEIESGESKKYGEPACDVHSLQLSRERAIRAVARYFANFCTRQFLISAT